MRVYLVEVDPGAPAWEVVFELLDGFAMADGPLPQVEEYWTGEPLKAYQRAALDGATVLWQPDAAGGRS